MRIIRSHVDQPLAVGQRITLPEDSSLHLLRVLRLEPGDAVTLFNGDGHDYTARLLTAAKRGAEAEITGREPVPGPYLPVAQQLAILKGQGIAPGAGPVPALAGTAAPLPDVAPAPMPGTMSAPSAPLPAAPPAPPTPTYADPRLNQSGQIREEFSKSGEWIR